MKELYRHGTLHIAKLDKMNYVIYDIRTLKVKEKGEQRYESYDYKFYSTLPDAVRAMAMRVGDEEADNLTRWLGKVDKALERACATLGEGV